MKQRKSTTPIEAAFYAAIDTEMLRKTDDGYDLSQFNLFWAKYQEALVEQAVDKVNYLTKMLEQERQDRANDRNYYRSVYRNRLISALVGLLLGSFLTELFLML